VIELSIRSMKVGAQKGNNDKYAYTLTEFRRGSCTCTVSPHRYKTRGKALAAGRKKAQAWQDAGWD